MITVTTGLAIFRKQECFEQPFKMFDVILRLEI
jgi:hypothetical protein